MSKHFLKLTQSDTLKGRAIVFGRWRIVWHKTIGMKGRGRSMSIWHHDKGES